MSSSVADRQSWVLPVLLAVMTAAAGGFAFLYLARPNAGDLGTIRVVVADENGQETHGLTVFVAEAPLTQNGTVTPGMTYTGIVYYPVPYRIKPNLKLTVGPRKYDVIEQTEFGFTWMARPLPADFHEKEVNEGAAPLDVMLQGTLEVAALAGRLKPGLVFEEFTWEAKGLRAPASDLPPKTFEQTGEFRTASGQEGGVHFKIPYKQPPNVTLDVSGFNITIITETTPTGFRWKNTGPDDTWNNTSAKWTAVGIL